MAQTASATAILDQIIDPKTGYLTWTGQKLLQQWAEQLAQGFDSGGNLISNLEPSVGIVGRGGNVGTILQHISDDGIVQSDGMVSATDTSQGAVVMPPGSSGNTLGTAAVSSFTDFDPTGSAGAALASANGYTDAKTAATLTAAQNFSKDAGNLSVGIVPFARLSGITLTIITAALTPLGSQGSQTFQNGLLVAQVPAT